MFVFLKLSPSCFTIIGLPFYNVRATLEQISVFSISPHVLSSTLGLISTVLQSCGIDEKTKKKEQHQKGLSVKTQVSNDYGSPMSFILQMKHVL